MNSTWVIWERQHSVELPQIRTVQVPRIPWQSKMKMKKKKEKMVSREEQEMQGKFVKHFLNDIYHKLYNFIYRVQRQPYCLFPYIFMIPCNLKVLSFFAKSSNNPKKTKFKAQDLIYGILMSKGFLPLISSLQPHPF